MTRPTKLTPDVAQRYCAAIAIGATKKMASAHAGVHPETAASWLKAGALQRRGPLFEFSVLASQAEASAALRNLRRIDVAAAKDWRAAAWFLERRHPGDFGRIVHQLVGDQNEPVEHVIRVVRTPVPLPVYDTEDGDGEPIKDPSDTRPVTVLRYFGPQDPRK